MDSNNGETTMPAEQAMIPKTREEAIAALVDLDVAQWGESEREAARKLYTANCPTYGRALNTLARRPEFDFGDARPDLVKAAQAALTSADWAELRKGG